MNKVLKTPKSTEVPDRPGWIPAEITENWDDNPYAYQTEEELMPAGGLHGQLLAYLMELLRVTLRKRGLMLLMDTFMLYRDTQGIKQRIAPDLLLMPWCFPPPSAYDLDVEPAPLCIFEVTSPNSRLKDLKINVPFYLGLGISSYLVIDAITPRSRLREQIELHVWQQVAGQPGKREVAADGSLPLPEMGLRVKADGQRIRFMDAISGQVLSDSEQLSIALQAERETLQAERQALQAERQTHLETQEAYRDAEAEIARLKALLAQQKG